MKQRSIKFTPAALDGIEVVAYSVGRVAGGQASASFKEALKMRLQHLAIHPARAPFLNKRSVPPVHKLTFKRLTIVLYTYDNESVTILGIVDARSNWQESFKE